VKIFQFEMPSLSLYSAIFDSFVMDVIKAAVFFSASMFMRFTFVQGVFAKLAW
jgi:hypothetical protein